MIRKPFIVFLMFAFLLIASWLVLHPRSDPLAPKFVRLTSLPAGPFGVEFIDSGGAIPFRDGKVWLNTALSATNWHSFLYDIDRRAVIGELVNGAVVLANSNQTCFICNGRSSPVRSLTDRLSRVLNRSGTVIKTNSIQTFWFLDVRNNSVRRLGEVAQWPGTSSRWRPAPGFRYGFNVPNTEQENHLFYLCDTENGTFQSIPLEGDIRGWWNDHEILVKDSTGNFLAVDVKSLSKRVLFSAAEMTKALHVAGITAPAKGFTAWPEWNGREYDFYFMADGVSRDNGHSFLLKASATNPHLALFSSDFQFGYLGRFDESARYYVHNGESGPSGRGGNGSVILRDLSNNSERVIVPTNITQQYPAPRIYKDTVIYRRDGVMWRANLDGSNSSRLLSPDSH